MDQKEIRDLLKQVAEGSLSVEQALLQIKLSPFSDLGYAKLDDHRAIRQGVAEVIYGAGKTPEQIKDIAAALLDMLATLLTFCLVRSLAKRFFSFVISQPFDALLGLAGGIFLGMVLTVLLAGTAFFEGGKLTEGFLASNSRIVHIAAVALEAQLEGSST